MIKVLYNALHLTGQFSGVQHTEEWLMKEAFHNPDPDICFEALCPKGYLLDFPNLPIQQLTNIGIDSSHRWQRIGYEQFLMKRHLESSQTNILHCPAYILPWNWKGMSVVTIHDIIALDFPEFCSTANRAYFRLALPRSIQKATKIIAVSHTVKNDILRRFPVDPAKIEVIYHGIDDAFRESPSQENLAKARQKYQLPEKFILFVGNIEPKKNIVRLVEAYQNLIRNTDIPHSLVIAGQFAWKYNDVLKKAALQENGRIKFPGYISQSNLPSVYALADLFIFPSLYEGFGIPPLEAMACGTPAIVSNTGALPEITAGNALVVDPLSTTSIESSMYRLLSDSALRGQLVEKGKLHAQKFRWNATWKATTNLYHSLIQKSLFNVVYLSRRYNLL